MRKKILSLALALVLCFGVLAGCGSDTGNGGPSSGSESGKPGVESSKPNNGGDTDYDPVAVMNERVQVVNDTVGFEFLELEETLKGGLFFHSLTQPKSTSRGTYDYNPDRQIDYHLLYWMGGFHMDGIVTEDTYELLWKFLLKSSEVAEAGDEAVELVFSLADMVETDDLHVFYACCDPGTIRGSEGPFSCCGILVKDTDIAYLLTVDETYYSPILTEGSTNYSAVLIEGLPYYSPAIDDVEYIFTSEFWKAFAQTAKFLGKTDVDLGDNGKTLIYMSIGTTDNYLHR